MMVTLFPNYLKPSFLVFNFLHFLVTDICTDKNISAMNNILLIYWPSSICYILPLACCLPLHAV